jgi:hypothetical protein
VHALEHVRREIAIDLDGAAAPDTPWNYIGHGTRSVVAV